MANVLIIEDDDVIAQGMARHLQSAGFDAVGVANGETGLARLRFERPDVCVLDLMLPGLDGWKVIEQARSEGIGTPIVVVSARGTEHDRVHALEIGADDYLTKPFGKAELLARISAIMRRVDAAPSGSGSAGVGGPLTAGTLSIDPGRHEARVASTTLSLTATEYRLLEALVRSGGDVVPHHRLARAGWPGEPDPDLLWLKPHLARLRSKVRQAGGPAIVAVRSVGYRIEA